MRLEGNTSPFRSVVNQSNIIDITVFKILFLITHQTIKMKSIQFIIMTIMVFISATLFAQTAKTEDIKVWGNCSLCKNHIETSLKVDGVAKADWNKKTKILTVTYDSTKITNDQIQKNIAAVGYDTEKYKGDDKAYNDIDECCQYDRKSTEDKKKD